jgi:hypothetical protein
LLVFWIVLSLIGVGILDALSDGKFELARSLSYGQSGLALVFNLPFLIALGCWRSKLDKPSALNNGSTDRITGGTNAPPMRPPPLPELEMYVEVHGKPSGPFTSDELQALVRDGRLTRTTLVWSQAYENWVPAGSVSILEPIFKKLPPPLPSHTQKSRSE